MKRSSLRTLKCDRNTLPESSDEDSHRGLREASLGSAGVHVKISIDIDTRQSRVTEYYHVDIRHHRHHTTRHDTTRQHDSTAADTKAHFQVSPALSGALPDEFGETSRSDMINTWSGARCQAQRTE